VPLELILKTNYSLSEVIVVFGRDKAKKEETPMAEPVVEKTVGLDAPLIRAIASVTKTVDMFKDTMQDVLDANGDVTVSRPELKDLVARCKGYSLIVEKEFKILRRRMQTMK
jgi:hypothetical protein